MSIESTENTQTSSLVNSAQSDVEREKTTEKVSGKVTGKVTGKKGKDKAGRKKKAKEHVEQIVVHIYASFNNTIVTVSKPKSKGGGVLSWASAGDRQFRGSKKSTPYAAQVATTHALKTAQDFHGIKTAIVYVRGPGPGRDAAVRAVQAYVAVTEIHDVTKTPHNGVRAPKPRRI